MAVETKKKNNKRECKKYIFLDIDKKGSHRIREGKRNLGVDIDSVQRVCRK